MSVVTVPSNYKPTEKEEYMNAVMLEYFRNKLLQWKSEIIKEADDLIQDLQDEGGMQEPDIADRASIETEVALEFRTRDRQRKLIGKIDEALERIRRGEYGYCEETGEPIGVRRLEARPVATLSVEAQERHERKERTQRDERE
ncbi:MAG: RNA polymerase-binding protein DksA [Alphaproteobacteria bacterium]|nr:RNA polymerase-binding protein DksA [Alphaproteobacteria bacterium]MBV8548486.1 RNA polymerase-binding protein DksA [Alphaproteobacteria bacterium]